VSVSCLFTLIRGCGVGVGVDSEGGYSRHPCAGEGVVV
jgi:hypothetical protein